MAINVSALTAFVDEQKMSLIGKSVISAKSAKLLNLQTGVKGSAAINILNNTTVFGDGSACGWSEAGTSVLSQRKIETGAIKINKSYCDKTLLKYWAGYDVKVAAGNKSLPFEQEFINAEIEGVAAALEVAIWQGDTTSGSANLNKFDGLIKIFDATTGVIDATNTDFTSITEANVITVVDNVFKAIPAELLDKDDVVIVCGADTFRKYVVALRTANMFHYVYDLEAGMELVIPGTSIKLTAVNGLNGTDRLFAFQTSNVYYGTDLEGDEEKFAFWYSQDNLEYRLSIEFVAGVQVAFPDQVVSFIKAS